MSQPKVSVIVAVYNVEDYIEHCLDSLFGQTLDSMEYIFVDDASPDTSVEIIEKTLERYPERKGQVKIIRHEKNLGVAAARTIGILSATGEYMIHCDPDDYVEITMYEEMYNEAKKNNSDLIFCDFEKHWDSGSIVRILNIPSTPHEYLKQRGDIHDMAPLWNILVRSSIIHSNNIIPFIDGDYSEDYGCVVRILYFSGSLSHIRKPLYHYIARPASLTHTKSKERFQKIRINLDGISEFFKDKKGFKHLVSYILLNYKFMWKHWFTENPDEWFQIYPHSHKAIFKLNKESFKTRLIWSLLLINKSFFIAGNKLYKRIKGKSLLDIRLDL